MAPGIGDHVSLLKLLPVRVALPVAVVTVAAATVSPVGLPADILYPYVVEPADPWLLIVMVGAINPRNCGPAVPYDTSWPVEVILARTSAEEA